MYLTLLEINPRDRAGAELLRNPYRLHQILVAAAPASPQGRILFRIEDERSRIIVQSPCALDWIGQIGRSLPLAGAPRQKEITLIFRNGQRLRFLLRANPTMRRVISTSADGERSDIGEGRPIGKRVGLLREADQRAWLERKGAEHGFRPLAFETRSHGLVAFDAGNSANARRQTHLSVDYEGYLEVTDPDRFSRALVGGIGAGKAFGFGLLSLAPP